MHQAEGSHVVSSLVAISNAVQLLGNLGDRGRPGETGPWLLKTVAAQKIEAA